MKPGPKNHGLEKLGFLCGLFFLGLILILILTSCGGDELEPGTKLVMSRGVLATAGDFYANPSMAPYKDQCSVNEETEVIFQRADGASFGNIWVAAWEVTLPSGKSVWIPAGSASPKD
jgi:hypothetical protein